MRAAVIRVREGRKILRTEEVPEPVCGPGEVVVHVAAAGICGSDLHGFLDHGGTSRGEGLIMGHEGAGTVVAVGRDVGTVAVGDRVTVDPQVVCGRCRPCGRGWISICDHKKVTGSSLRGFVQGMMAERIAVAASQVHVLPDAVPFDQGAVIEPLANALHVVRRSPIGAGSAVMVLGCGPLGLCLVQAARMAGAGRIVATDLSPARRAMAARLGADAVLDPRTEDPRAAALEHTDGIGMDVVIESVGIDETYGQAIGAVRKRGAVMFFGAIRRTVTLELLPILHREITMIGCTGANEETPEAVRLVAEGKVDVASLITHRFPLDEAQAAFDTMRTDTEGAIKVQIAP